MTYNHREDGEFGEGATMTSTIKEHLIAAAEKAAFDAAYGALSGADYDETQRAVSIALDAYRAALPTPHVVFDTFPSPEGSRLIEVEDGLGNSINFGEWRERADGLVELVF